MEAKLARKLARAFPEEYLNLANWSLFDDTLEALEQLSDQGWRHLILSNHVPELQTLVDGLGLSEHIEQVFNSAPIGYEKPHSEIFKPVLQHMDGATAWMIGDNPIADVQGAEAVGIPAVLVRKPYLGMEAEKVRFSANLRGLSEWIGYQPLLKIVTLCYTQNQQRKTLGAGCIMPVPVLYSFLCCY